MCTFMYFLNTSFRGASISYFFLFFSYPAMKFPYTYLTSSTIFSSLEPIVLLKNLIWPGNIISEMSYICEMFFSSNFWIFQLFYSKSRKNHWIFRIWGQINIFYSKKMEKLKLICSSILTKFLFWKFRYH